MGKDVMLSDRCCGESGTLGTSRPDIASQLRFRKIEELNKGMKQLNPAFKQKILTSCPACQQGLIKYEAETGLQTDYVVVELVRNLFGEDWKKQFIKQTKEQGVERVLL